MWCFLPNADRMTVPHAAFSAKLLHPGVGRALCAGEAVLVRAPVEHTLLHEVLTLLLLAQLPPGSVDVEILHDATRREARGGG